MTDISYQQDLASDAVLLAGGSFTIASSSSRTVEKIINVICKPSYSISQVKLSNDTTKDNTQTGGVEIESIPSPGNKTLDNLSDGNMTSIFVAAVSAARALFGE
ncbi:MAG: hypothetical protein M1823_009134, partial [Watsoniomyces obsoletus]